MCMVSTWSATMQGGEDVLCGGRDTLVREGQSGALSSWGGPSLHDSLKASSGLEDDLDEDEEDAASLSLPATPESVSSGAPHRRAHSRTERESTQCLLGADHSSSPSQRESARGRLPRPRRVRRAFRGLDGRLLLLLWEVSSPLDEVPSLCGDLSAGSRPSSPPTRPS